MERIFISPGKYVQGPGLLQKSAAYLQVFGTSFVLLCDDFVWELCGSQLVVDAAKSKIQIERLAFSGESSVEELTRLKTLVSTANVNGVIALGGGKTVDSGKALANELKLPAIIMPTTASTDAATSAISVAYTVDGLFKGYDHYENSPALILVDSQLIFNAPTSLLIDGIADALATALEVRVVAANPKGLALSGGRPTLTAQGIAETCEATIFRDSLQAITDQKNGRLSEAFENIVEANTLLSGLGFESGGLAGAHSIHNGLATLGRELNRVSHGRKVAYGILIQLLLTNASHETLETYLDFYAELGLPRNLQELGGGEFTQEDKEKIASQATMSTETIHYLNGEITAAKVMAAMDELEELNLKK